MYEEAECLMKQKNITCQASLAAGNVTPHSSEKKRTGQNRTKIHKKIVNPGTEKAAGLMGEALFIKEESSPNVRKRRRDLFEGFDTAGDDKSYKSDDNNCDSSDTFKDCADSCVVSTPTRQIGVSNLRKGLPDVCVDSGSSTYSATASFSKPSADYVTADADTEDFSTKPSSAIADGGIVLLMRQLTTDSSGADLTLSDWEGLATDEDD